MKIKSMLFVIFILLFVNRRLYTAVLTNLIITENTVWDGEIIVPDIVQVERTAVLTIQPGTVIKFASKAAGLNIEGTLIANGNYDQKIVFRPSDENDSASSWQGIVFYGIEPGAYSQLSNCVIKSANSGVTYSMEAKGKIENCVFSKNGRGIYLLQESEVTIKNTDFMENSEAGIFCERSYAKIINSRFFDNKKCGLIFIRGGNNIVYSNLIEKNGNGLILSQFGTNAEIRNNIIQENETGILIERWADSKLSHNTLKKNGTGVHLNSGGKAQITFNEITGNKIGILNVENFSLSANDNNIYENTEYDISLKNVSSAYNRRDKIKDSQDVSKIPFFVREKLMKVAEEYLREYFDARGNFWGEELTKEMKIKGESGNITKFFDFYDNPSVEMEGIQYKSDYILYKEWRDKPVEGAGAALRSSYGPVKVDDNTTEVNVDNIQLKKGVLPRGLGPNTDQPIENQQQNPNK
ncbi:MAG: right-handed parallel beta-helix repeat-containing protein [bacterium]|nr:right-handed parallel beta-helix repeat-containing protein [bacterium]